MIREVSMHRKNKIKILNCLLGVSIIGVIFFGTDIKIASNVNVSRHIKVILIISLMIACLISLILLSACTTIKLYHYAETIFDNTEKSLSKATNVALYFFGIIINVNLCCAIIFFLNYRIKLLRSPLSIVRSNPLGLTLLFIGISCILQSSFALIALIRWSKNFKYLIPIIEISKYANKNDHDQNVYRGAGSIIESLLGWVFFFLGFLFLSFRVLNVYVNKFFVSSFFLMSLFIAGILFILASYIGSHHNEKMWIVHQKISCITTIFEYFFKRTVNINDKNLTQPLLSNHSL